MSIEENIKSTLATATGKNVYPLVKGQGATFPVILYRRISYMPRRTHSGAVDMKRARFQIDVYSTSYKEVRELTETVKTTMEVNQTNWTLSYIVNETELTEENLYRVILDVIIEYK